MFTQSAEFYDSIYEAKGKNYEEEVRQLLGILSRHGVSTGGTLLELACGTGNHTRYLKEHFKVQGLDLDPAMLELARERFPEVSFHCQDMTTFQVNDHFDVILCLFSAIGYASTPGTPPSRLRNHGGPPHHEWRSHCRAVDKSG